MGNAICQFGGWQSCEYGGGTAGRSYSSLPKHCLNSFPKEVAQVRPIRGWSHIVAVGSVSPALRRGSADGTPSYRSWVRSWGCRPALT
ncbi:hypothetical protein CRG98_005667 [Punica granatum]|uniref:Uncharacterized protein n=1 Tax=Punica granatum TaxID=22663 RepID=A0A2I0KZS3_PUNGR|nr:hypothetical protein CRG98_005667 [Punica granatum]